MEEENKESSQNFTERDQEAFMLACTGLIYKEIEIEMGMPSADAAEQAVRRGAKFFLYNGKRHSVKAAVAIALWDGTAAMLFDKFRHKHAKQIARIEKGNYTGPVIHSPVKDEQCWEKEFLSWLEII